MAVKQITFRVEPEEYDVLEAQWKQAGFKKLQEAGEYAFRAAFKKDVPGEIPGRYNTVQDDLKAILVSGNEDTIKAVAKMLGEFRALLDLVARKAP